MVHFARLATSSALCDAGWLLLPRGPQTFGGAGAFLFIVDGAHLQNVPFRSFTPAYNTYAINTLFICIAGGMGGGGMEINEGRGWTVLKDITVHPSPCI